MDFRFFTVLGLTLACTGFSGCKRGFNFNDVEDTVDITYAGPTEDASWTLIKPNASGEFTLEKRIEPGDDTLAYGDGDVEDDALTGRFSNLSSGFIKFTIDSEIPAEIDDGDDSTTDNIIVGIQIQDHAVILFPFEVGSTEFIALVPNEETCPTSSNGTGLFIDKTGDATSASSNYINSFSYSNTNDVVELNDGLALDTDFTEIADYSYSTYSDECSNSITTTSDGDYYHNKAASVIETEENDYSRFISFTYRSIPSLSAFDSEDYVGYLRKFSAPDDYYYLSASCISGVCTLRQESDYETLTAVTPVYTITLDDDTRNDPSTGMIRGTISDLQTPTNPDANVACVINTSTDDDEDSTSMLIACNAQAPDDNDEIIHFMLKVDIE